MIWQERSPCGVVTGGTFTEGNCICLALLYYSPSRDQYHLTDQPSPDIINCTQELQNNAHILCFFLGSLNGIVFFLCNL